MAIIELNVNQEMKEVREILNVSKKTKKKNQTEKANISSANKR